MESTIPKWKFTIVYYSLLQYTIVYFTLPGKTVLNEKYFSTKIESIQISFSIRELTIFFLIFIPMYVLYYQ